MATLTFSGIASGIDTASLIEATLQQKRSARIEPLEKQISSYGETNSSLEKLQSMLKELKDYAAKFRAINGNGITLNANSNDESVLTASISAGASAGSYDFTVQQLATASSSSFSSSGRTYSSRDAVINSALTGSAADRTVNFSIGKDASNNPLESIDITVTDSMTLSQFVAEFNSRSSLATASIINKGTDINPDYAVVINSNKEGVSEGYIATTVGSALTDSNTFDNQAHKVAQNAVIETAGLTIERSSNKVSDIVPGVTLQLQQLGSARITVGADSDTTVEQLQDFVDCYNDIIDYIKENDLVTEEDDEIIYGSLSKTSIDENIMSSLRSAMSGLVGSGSINILADLGVTTERDGKLKFDSKVLEDAIDSDSTGVANLLQSLGERFGATGGVVDSFTCYNGLLDLSINGNKTAITSLQSRISTLEGQLSNEETALTRRFASLESIMAQLQSSQSYLTALLPAN